MTSSIKCLDCGWSSGHASGCSQGPRLFTPDTPAQKFDSGKDPWSLFPWDAAAGIVKILDFGAKKYAPRNWEKGMDWNRPFDACIRHLTAWWSGESRDAETKHSHLWHAGCCILFLIAYEIRGVGKDNRPKNTVDTV